MKAIKFFCLIYAVVLVTVAACSNKTATGNAPIAPAPAPAATVNNIPAYNGFIFTGKADIAQVSVEFFDNYLQSSMNGNNNVGAGNGQPASKLPYSVQTELKITNFKYYGNSVDITCSKQDVANRINFLTLSGTVPTGTIQNGNNVNYSPGSDGEFYFCSTTLDVNGVCAADASGNNGWMVQDARDEISMATLYETTISFSLLPNIGVVATTIEYAPAFNCSGSDGADYTVILHGAYKYPNTIADLKFDLQKMQVTGVLGVVKKYYNEKEVPLFLEE